MRTMGLSYCMTMTIKTICMTKDHSINVIITPVSISFTVCTFTFLYDTMKHHWLTKYKSTVNMKKVQTSQKQKCTYKCVNMKKCKGYEHPLSQCHSKLYTQPILSELWNNRLSVCQIHLSVWNSPTGLCERLHSSCVHFVGKGTHRMSYSAYGISHGSLVVCNASGSSARQLPAYEQQRLCALRCGGLEWPGIFGQVVDGVHPLPLHLWHHACWGTPEPHPCGTRGTSW